MTDTSLVQETQLSLTNRATICANAIGGIGNSKNWGAPGPRYCGTGARVSL